MDTRTIMIFPKFENIHIIDDIRKKYDPLADLVLPHITLVFPFNSELTNEELNLHLEKCLRGIPPFKIELNGFSKRQDKYGNYLFLNIVQGKDEIINIHSILYKDKLKKFDLGYDYIPHMTVGKLPSKELLDKAFDDVNKCNYRFSTVVNKISVEMIGDHEESSIVIEYEVK
ncbi:2'-5' RNA ligase family protein [Clostridium folliculivorans]|uniref:2'-5' RNA ligase family protein n=1 Tax=Clostridium folliculivorans TaxID=2886038 RepID=UPI0021C2DCC9|nr:2'-5' RNA ligase family protein [Clostridium folliculivorans]GKU30317.1 2'-5' RNA ligase [Clostridium folliculivorans]